MHVLYICICYLFVVYSQNWTPVLFYAYLIFYYVVVITWIWTELWVVSTGVCRWKVRIRFPRSNGKFVKTDFLIKRTFCCDHDKNFMFLSFIQFNIPLVFVPRIYFCYMAKYTSERDEANPAFWLAIQTGNMGSSCPLGISRVGPASKSSLFGHIINLFYYINTNKIPSELSRNFSSRVEKNISLARCAHSWNIFQHLKMNFVSPRGHVISSISTKIVRSRWLNIVLVIFFLLLTSTSFRSIKSRKRTWSLSSHLDLMLGQ